MSATASDAMPEGYRETYRSQVVAWECDVVEHFTVENKTKKRCTTTHNHAIPTLVANYTGATVGNVP